LGRPFVETGRRSAKNGPFSARLTPHGFLELSPPVHHFHGDDWDEGLAVQWREAIEKAPETMFDGYDRDYIY
jgi:hypothetical protein